MSKLVLGIGASHTTLMNTQWDKVNHLERAHAFRNALGAAREALHQARPDAVVIVGSNHFRGFWLDLMPSFTIGVGEVISSGEHGTPAGNIASDEDLALHISNTMVADGFDLAFSTRLSIDHGISHAVQWLIGEQSIPIVPIVINCFAPPLPTLPRTAAFGAALRQALLAAPGAKRIAVIGTGGLSHQLPFPDWRTPKNDDDEFLVESWRNGRGRWKDYEARRRALIIAAPPSLNEPFDAQVLDWLEQGRLDEFHKHYSEKELVETAGNGANEVRAWLVMAAALGNKPGRTLAYSPMPEWLTGMAVALIDN